MARYTGPRVRISRRFGIPIFGPTKYLERRNYGPGVHGPKSRRKHTDYGLGLIEKQKLRYYYGLLERQFRGVYEKALRRRGVTGEQMLQILETRLDNVVYHLGLANTRAAARQMVCHGHIQVNGRKVNIPSFQVKPGDEVAVREPSKNHPTILAARDATAHAPSPGWMDVDRENLRGKIGSLPKRDELVQIPINEQLIVELYSK